VNEHASDTTDSAVVVRVVIADDHPTFRRGLAALLASVPDIDLVGEAVDGESAVERSRALNPDVVLMDLNMPGVGGVEATRRIVADAPAVAVLVVSMLDDDEAVFAAMRAGARGYVVKGQDTDDVLRAIRSVARGDAVFGPAVASRVLSYLTRPLSARDPLQFPELSVREREVLELLAGGNTNSEIARALVLSPKTVRNHVSSIFTKLQVAGRAEAVERARAAGLGGGFR
jgi:DNA-binding NarL/FixJ family response regulator